MHTRDCMYNTAFGSGAGSNFIQFLHSISSSLLLSESFCVVPRQIFAFKSTQTEMSFPVPLLENSYH